MSRIYCRSCTGPLQHVIDLGSQSPSNALLLRADQPERTYPLHVAVCTSCWLMQTETDVSHTEIFSGIYPYYSGGSQQWREHCKQYAAMITARLGLGPGSYVVEFGGNDGTMLQNFNCETLNIEPSASVAKASMSRNIPTVVGRAQDVTANRRGADLIIANNVIAHDPDLNGFAAAISRNLALTGTCTIEFPWTVKLLEDCQFDTIYHEHYSYLSLTALGALLQRHGLYIRDAESLDVHGGSLRVYIGHREDAPASFRLLELFSKEDVLHDMRIYGRFRERAFNCLREFHLFLQEHGPVYGMGAAAKAAVFANCCGLTNKDVIAIGDVTPAKWGKFMPGSRIPILTETQVFQQKPEYLWIAAWNWKDEITRGWRAMGYKGKFVTAVPQLEVFE